jgi:SAM-dependent methyltransferase
MSKRTIGEWFDDGSHAADEEVGWLLNGEYRRQAGFLAPHLRAAGQAGVLEVGCRSGLLARTLAILEPGLHYVGYEASGKLLAMARERGGDLKVPVDFFPLADLPPPGGNGTPAPVVVAFCHLKHVGLDDWDSALAGLLARAGLFAAFDYQQLGADLDDGTEFPHVYVTESRVQTALEVAGFEEAGREVWHEAPLRDKGIMRNVALWCRRKVPAADSPGGRKRPTGRFSQ